MLKLSGAWLCGLSSVPQGSGLARVLVLYAKLRSSRRSLTILVFACEVGVDIGFVGCELSMLGYPSNIF